MGFRLGYVKLPIGHPWRKPIAELEYVNVHGDITFSGELYDDGNWWIGFDCGHYTDAPDYALAAVETPRHVLRLLTELGGVVRTRVYVEQECCKLCEQVSHANHI
jgi:hypothetical protein